MDKQKQFTFDKYSNTIRLMPANYLVAVRPTDYFIADCDAAIPDILAARVFIMLRGLQFEKNIDNITASLTSLLNDDLEIFSVMGQYLSDDEENYPEIVKSLRLALTEDPNGMIDFVEYTCTDGINTDTINVWEKVEMEFTVREFCELVGIS